jgi:hypothetical protein|tara:strand:- start:1082 stop:1795 length:714 start_codon:yes stop_codon:yes gene_type:complete
MTTIEKIKNLLLSKEESKEVKMYAEMILDDGRVLATEDDQFMIGSTVMVVGDDGETSPLGAGSYTMSDGMKLTIDENSKILDMGEDKDAEAVENEEEKEEMKEEEKEMEEIDEEKLSKAIFDHTPDHVDEDKAREMAKKVKEMAYGDKEEMSEEVEEEVQEEIKEEEKEEEMVEMSKDMISSLVEEVEELKSQIIELEKTPGSDGFTHNPEVYNKSEKEDLSKMSVSQRAAYYINNK